MPVTRWKCPECGETWHTNRQLNCGACLVDRVKVVRGVPDDAKTETVRESITRQALQARGEVT